jgi:hypothetical protein
MHPHLRALAVCCCCQLQKLRHLAKQLLPSHVHWPHLQVQHPHLRALAACCCCACCCCSLEQLSQLLALCLLAVTPADAHQKQSVVRHRTSHCCSGGTGTALLPSSCTQPACCQSYGQAAA